MPTNYPSGTDKFFEPSLPEEIPLSQTGYQPGASGTLYPARNHVEHHRDLGDAVQALQENAAKANHDHSGSASNPSKGPKLAQANTHQNADTDAGLASIHHTLGTGQFQAAAGNHTHDYDGGTILNAPFLRMTRQQRENYPNPADGLNVYETDTNRMRVYTDFGRGNGARWNILPTANIPIVRLVQSEAQSLTSPSVLVKWSLTDEGEDTFAFFNPGSSDASKQNITVTEPGVYQIDVAVQWGTGFIPEMATVVVCKNGAETTLRYQRIQTPNFILSLLNLPIAQRSQTIAVSGKLRFSVGDVLSVKCKYGGLIPGGQFDGRLALSRTDEVAHDRVQVAAHRRLHDAALAGKGASESLRGQVLGIAAVAGEHPGQAEDRVGVLAIDLGEAERAVHARQYAPGSESLQAGAELRAVSAA